MIAGQYRLAVATLRQARRGILAALLIYAACGIGGWLYADALGFLDHAAGDLVGAFAGKAGVAFVLALFTHNLVATYVTMCMLTLWGLVPLVTTIFNGLLIGWIVTVVSGVSASDMAMLLVPHGLFEWPAMLIAWGIGFWRGIGYRFAPTPTTYLDRWIAANRVFGLFVLPLLLVAAAIEGRTYLLPGFFD